jgi:gliding motility-associated protein GldM
MSAGGSVNPLRQQMINMMYLVLMALLALNVSADILKAFALVNKGLVKTNGDYLDKNNATMKSFQKIYDLDKAKAQKNYDNATQAKAVSEKMYDYIQSIKQVFANRCGGWLDEGKTQIEDDKNLETSLHYFLKEPENAAKKHGALLKDSLNAYIKEMEALTGNTIPIKIDTKDPGKNKEGDIKTWEEYYWEGVPSIAAVTELTKFQNDIRTAEGEVVTWNLSQVGAEEQHFNSLIAMVSSETPIVSQGQTYKASIVLGAYNTTVTPRIEVNGNMLSADKISGGQGHYESTAGGQGDQTVKVRIFVKNPKTGKDTFYTTETKYQVFTGAATIAADKMNMLYIGLDNPISASAAGFTPANTNASIIGGGGSFKMISPGHYMLKPDGSKREITVGVSVKMSDGTTKSMGQMVYRVRPIPHPEVLFGTKSGGAISRGEIATVSQVNAGLGEGFAFEGLKYTVTAYTFAIAPKSGPSHILQVQGNRITAECRNFLGGVHTGDLIIIANVNAMGPSGKVVLSGPTLTVK